MVIKSREPSRKELSALVVFVVSLFFLSACANPLITQIAEPKIVTFDTNGGSQIENQIVYVNYPIIKPQAPVKSNYNFDNWYSENENFETPWDFSTIPETDITLYANWTPDTSSGQDNITIIVLDIDNIPAALGVTFTPAVTPSLTLSRTGASYPATQAITVTGLNAGDTIGWSIKGVGVYADKNVTGTTTPINLDATNVNYNSLGGHTVELNITKGGIQYRTSFVFQIVQ